MLKSVKINGIDGKASIEVDGKELEGVVAVNCEQEVNSLPSVTIKCQPRMINIDFDIADVKFSFEKDWIDVNKLLPDIGRPVLALIQDKTGLHQEVLTRQHFEETDAIYEGVYWCSYRTLNIEALGINKVLAWQVLPSEELL